MHRAHLDLAAAAIVGLATTWITPSGAACECPAEQVVNCGHRGTGQNTADNPFPENTLESLLQAALEGASMVELDVVHSADGVLVSIHDDTVNRTTDGTGCVGELSVAQLQALDAADGTAMAGQGVTIPTLSEVLAALDIDLNIELKINETAACPASDKPRMASDVIAAIGADSKTRRIVVSSFDLEVLDEIKALDPAQPAGLISGRLEDGAVAQDHGLESLNLWTIALTEPSTVSDLQALGLEVGVWTENLPERMSFLLDAGVDMIITDEPDVLQVAQAELCDSHECPAVPPAAEADEGGCAMARQPAQGGATWIALVALGWTIARRRSRASWRRAWGLPLLTLLGCAKVPAAPDTSTDAPRPPSGASSQAAATEQAPAGHLTLNQVARFGGAGMLADEEATVAALSPTGDLAASGGGRDERGEAIVLWNPTTGARLGLLGGEKMEVTKLAFSADGKTLAASEISRTIVLWDVATRKVKARLQGHQDSVYDLALAPGGQHLVSSDGNGVVLLWDLTTGKPHQLVRDAKGIGAVAFSNAGDTLAVAHRGRITIWNVARRSTTREHPASTGIHCMRYGARDQTLILGETAQGREQLTILDATTGAVQRTLTGHRGHINALRLTADGRTLVSGSGDGTVRVWDVASGSQRAELRTGGKAVWSVDLSPDGQRVIAAGQGRIVPLWDLRTARRVFAEPTHADWVVAVAYSPDGDLLVSGDAAGKVVTRRAHAQAIQYRLPDLDRSVGEICFSPDGAQLVVSAGPELQVFSAKTGKPQKSPWQAQPYSAVRFSPDGKLLAGASSWPTVDLVSASSGAVVRGLGKPHQGDHTRQNIMSPTSVAFSPDGQHLATARWDEPVRIWEVATGELLRTLPGTLHVAYAPDGRHLAAGFGTISYRETDVSLRVWDLSTDDERPRCILETRGEPQFRPNTLVVAAIVDDGVTLWDATTCAPVGRAASKDHRVASFAFSPDGRFLTTGGHAGDVVVWQLK